ncbi:MAG: hypothetical protein Q7J08_03920 [Methanocorpusculum sp.]|uniref:hypothetical protein n=1 Tax=Methanocorpusculum sp. TaxID=2058474 RepID=UPI0027194EA8|nr:hypothetical protein [Methanocorpusculum sp.]MDO9522843.1 hypothetical protein [Methanocorpusculum sp.]
MQTTNDEIISYLDKLERSALFLLSGANNSPIPGDTAYQKELFLIANYDEELNTVADFQAYNFGPFSEPGETAMENLIVYGLAEKIDEKYLLTKRGKEIADLLKNEDTDVDLDEIEDVKIFLNDMTHDERILFTYILHPDYTSESKIREKVLAKRIPLSISLYKKGKVGLEMAAHLAGISMENLLDKMRVKRNLA